MSTTIAPPSQPVTPAGSARSSAHRIPHLHLLLDRKYGDADLGRKLDLISTQLDVAPTTSVVNGHLRTVWADAGLVLEYSQTAVDETTGLPVWTTTAVSLYRTAWHGENDYNGPTPGNVIFGMTSEQVAAGPLKGAKMASSGEAHGADRLVWERYDYGEGELKCSFSDGRATASARSGAKKFSPSLSNKQPVTLLLILRPAAGVSKMMFMTRAEADRVAAANEAARGKSRGGETNVKLAHYSSRETRTRIHQRQAIYDMLFGKTHAVHFEYRTDRPNVDLVVYAPAEGRAFWAIVSNGLSDLRVDAPAAMGAQMSLVPPTVAGAASQAASNAGSNDQGAPSVAGGSSRVGGTARSLSRNVIEDPSPLSRVELIFYSADEPTQAMLDLVRYVARTAAAPISAHLRHGLTLKVPSQVRMDLDTKPVATVLETVFLANVAMAPESSLPEELSVDGDAVKFLQIIPISMFEKSKTYELNERLSRVAAAVVYSRERAPYVVG